MKRAERRHHKNRILARRRKILRESTGWGVWEKDLPSKYVRHAHINCNCFGLKEYAQHERRTREREEIRIEEITYI